MNERIREFEKLATETVKCGLNGSYTTERFSRKKFAELIVQKCMSCCDVVEKVEWIEPTTYEFGVQACKVKIQTHFGVKE